MESNKEPEITGGKKRIGIVAAIAAAVCIVAVAVIFIVTGGTERRQAESDKTGGTSVSAEDAAAEGNASVGEETDKEGIFVEETYAEEMAVIADAAVGDIVTFGSYEQDNDLENGMEPVEWYVLDKEDGEATLMSVYLLDWQPYNEDFIGMTWEDCTLRSW